MIVVNFYGGPGVGKSTAAAKIFYELKTRGVRSELVGEFAKELVYNRAYTVLSDQLYLFSEQAHRLRMLDKYGVQVAICDSPLLLSPIYGKEKNLVDMALREYSKYDNYNFVLERVESYLKDDARKASFEQAHQKDMQILALLRQNNIPYSMIGNVLDITSEDLDSLAEEAKKSDSIKKPPFNDEPWKAA